MMNTTQKSLQDYYLDLEAKHGAHDYHPLPVVLARGEGVFLWDVEGKKYYDFLSAYSAVNQGHCHPEIVGAMKAQAETLPLTSRAFHNNKLGEYMKFITEYFGFEKVLCMNTGAEGVETAIKITRKWGTRKRFLKIRLKSLFVITIFTGEPLPLSLFHRSNSKQNFGPYATGFIHVPYDDLDALEAVLIPILI